MKNQLLLLLLCIGINSYSQEKRVLISGTILFDNYQISDVHVINKNSNQGSSTNDFGYYEITVKLGDYLEFTHLNYQKRTIQITQEILSNRKLDLILKEKTYDLEEITFKKMKSILYLDPEIMPPPSVNAKTLKLPFANTKVKTDDAIVKIRSGGVLSLDNLINTLNGNKKRQKQLQKISREDKELLKIRAFYTDDFFITDLKIKKQNINPFLNYCIKNNIIFTFKRNNKLKLTTILIAESRKFLEEEEIKLSMLNKN